MQPGVPLVAKNGLAVRAARDSADIDAAQHLRYRVFYEELAARAEPAMRRSRRDGDAFDAICDHLLVVNQRVTGDDPILLPDGELVGTYRLLRQDVAEANSGFYTQAEFDVAPLVARKAELDFLELGRSCVLAPFRTRPVVELLWQGIWNYVRDFGLDVMMGCASLVGTDPDEHAQALSYLAQHCASPPEWRVRALPDRYVEMNRLHPEQVNFKTVLRELPPLIRGYLRLGATIGDGAIVDRQFNTIDVLIMLPVSLINPRYFEYFGAPDAAPALSG
jgi:L-ornithine Nalpha-acyltransferase